MVKRILPVIRLSVRSSSLRTQGPLGLPNDHPRLVSDSRVYGSFAKKRRGRLQSAVAQGVPAVAPRRCRRAPLVRRELSGRLHLLRIRALAAAHFTDLQGLGEET